MRPRTCRWLRLIADFDRAEGFIHFGFPTCAEWLAWSCGALEETNAVSAPPSDLFVG